MLDPRPHDAIRAVGAGEVEALLGEHRAGLDGGRLLEGVGGDDRERHLVPALGGIREPDLDQAVGSGNGSGRKIKPSETLKIVVLAAIPRPSETIATIAKPGLRRSERTANARS